MKGKAQITTKTINPSLSKRNATLVITSLQLAKAVVKSKKQ
jgi:hypothetical protein